MDGRVSVDFGVKGGELNATTRAPTKLDYYAISARLGQAADAVIDVSENKLATCSPIDDATAFFGDEGHGDQCPLNGVWKLLFTTAADASFSSSSTRGDATAQNTVDARRGRIVNQIAFRKPNSVVKELNVVLHATAVSKRRLELKFRYAEVVFRRFLWWKRPCLYIPVPGPFLTRILVLFSKLFRRGKYKKPPPAHFDVLYLDDELRIQKTGQDNLFVQTRPSFSDAQDLLL